MPASSTPTPSGAPASGAPEAAADGVRTRAAAADEALDATAQAQLAQAAAAGDRQAYARLVQRHQRGLFGHLGRLGLGAAEAEDLAQDAFLRAWQQLPRFDPQRGAFSTWLYTLAHRLALNHLDRAEQRHRAPARRSDDPDEAAPEPVCPQPGPAEALQLRQQRDAVQAALRTLPLADRSVLALAYVQELGLDDVARIEGLSPAAAKARLHRARLRLRALLTPPAPEETP